MPKCLSLGRECGWSPSTAAQGHKASRVCWRCRQTMFLLPPPLLVPRLDLDLSIPETCHSPEPPRYLSSKPGDRLCHYRVPGCSPRPLVCRWNVVPPRNGVGVLGGLGMADVETSQQVYHIFSPSFCPSSKKCMFSHCVISVKT